MSTPLAKQDLEREYRLYNAACNAHEFDRLAEFVAQNVVLNGETHGLQA
jgi:predicted ester cyclase